jgi:hypothetical protein
VEAGKPTEIAVLNGEIVRLAEENYKKHFGGGGGGGGGGGRGTSAPLNAALVELAGPGRHRPPCHPTHFEPSYLRFRTSSYY